MADRELCVVSLGGVSASTEQRRELITHHLITEAMAALHDRSSVTLANITFRTLEAARRDDDAIYAIVRLAADAEGVDFVQLDRGSVAEALPELRNGAFADFCLLRGADEHPLATAIRAVHDRVLPPCGGWPEIAEEEARPFCGTTRMQPWLSGGGQRPLRALVGHPGAWVTVESADGERLAPPSTPLDTELLVLSASSREELVARIESLPSRFTSASLHEVARDLGRESLHSHRAAVVASSTQEAIDALNALLPKLRAGKSSRIRTRAGAQYADTAVAGREGKIAFLFPGQGSYHTWMHAELVPRFAPVREWFEELDRISISCGDRLAHYLYPPAFGISAERQRRIEQRVLEPEIGGQAGIGGSLGILAVLRDGGIVPEAVAGYSNGEHAALAAAGVIPPTEHDALITLLTRMRVLGEEADAGGRIPKGATYAVSGIALEELLALDVIQRGDVHLMMDNCPNQRIVFGSEAAMSEALAQLSARGALAVKLPLERGYHTPLFARKAAHIRELYGELPIEAPTIPIYSAMTAAPMPHEPDAIRDTAASQWMSTVRFRETIERMYDDGARIFIEVGAGSKLTGFVNDTLRGREYLALASDVEGRSALASLQQLVADLAIAGRVDAYERLLPCHCVSCGAAGFSPRNVDGGLKPAAPQATIVEQHFALMNEFLRNEEALAREVFASLRGQRATQVIERTLSLATDPWLAEHALGRSAAPVIGGRALPIVPLTVTLEFLADAALQVTPGVVTKIESVRAHRWLALDDDTLTLRIAAQRCDDGRIAVTIHDRDTLCAEGAVTVAAHYTPLAPRVAIDANGFHSRLDARAFYDLLFHGPLLQSIRGARALDGARIDCDAVMPWPAAPFHTPAMLLDASGQTAGWWLLEVERALCNIFPFEIDAVSFHAPVPQAGRALQIRASVDAGPVVVTTSTDFVDGETLIARVENLRMRRFVAPVRLAELLAGKRATLLDDDAELPIAFLISADEIWLRALAQLFLTSSERREWYALPRGRRRAEWLLDTIRMKENPTRERTNAI